MSGSHKFGGPMSGGPMSSGLSVMIKEAVSETSDCSISSKAISDLALVICSAQAP